MSKLNQYIGAMVGAVVVMAFAALLGAFAAPRASLTVDPALAAMVAQYEAITSVDLEASVEVVFPGPSSCCGAVTGTTITGTYSFAAAEDKYRITTAIDPTRMPHMDIDVAFDGQTFQLLRHEEESILSFGAGDKDLTIPGLPNPFLALFEFVYVRDDATWDAPLKLNDVGMATAQSRISSVTWSIESVGGRTLDRTVFSGGTLDGEPFDFHVYTEAGVRARPVRVDYVTSDGVISSVELGHYRPTTPGGSMFWPRAVTYRKYDEEGSSVAEVSFLITSLAVNEPIDPSRFVIDSIDADYVWIDDLEFFMP